jgi:diguanylate cyclase (GGDEF)-like protein
VTHPDDLDVSVDTAEVASRGGEIQRAFEKRHLRADGTTVVVAWSTALVTSPSGHPLYFFSQGEDITERRRNERELADRARQQEAVARLGQVALRSGALDQLMDEVVETVVATLDVEFCKVLELAEDGEELRCVRAVGGDDSAGDEGVASGMSVGIEGRKRAFGVLAVHSSRERSFSADDVNFVQAVANVLSTAVERHRNDEANRHAALHDPLTGLPNRTLLLDRIEQALRRREREGTTVAVLVIDVDRFKLINDSLGHARGDALLRVLAPRLREAARAGDTVGRLGGDEFVVVCESLDGPEQADALAERIGRAINQPVVLRSGEHVMTASIGVAVANCPDATAELLLRDADIAMYRAKDLGRGRYERFDDEMREQVLGRVRTERELRRAIGNDELRLQYQPVVEIESGRPTGVEALVRWQHPQRGLVPPDEFIPIAEEAGLIGELDLWVLNEACNQVATWQRDLAPDLELWVNVSGKKVGGPGFPARVATIARAAGLAPRTLGLEITETVFLEEAESPTAALSLLRAHDIRLALDDFGTGYSSLGYLKRFDLDILKVDRSFIDGLGTDSHDSAIVGAIVKMAQTLGLGVVAEGVETIEQLDQLRQLGCDQAQGYLFARPLAPGALEAFLAAPPSARPATLAGLS